MTGFSIRTLERPDIGLVLPVMDAGFRDDPTVVWYHEGLPGVFEREHQRYVAMNALAAIEGGGLHATEAYDAAAVWFAPGQGVSDATFEAFAQTVERPDRMEKLGELAEQCDTFRPSEPHWTLELLAVDPAAQGKGLGSVLVAYGLGLCDRARQPAFLASSNRRNLPFYERLGFETLGEVSVPGMPPMYPMLRRAQEGSRGEARDPGAP